MLKTGLCSITFRKLTPEQIIKLAVKAGLEGIEWGGDVHVPAGNSPNAAEVAKMTKQAGLEVSSYGSYYRVGGKNEVSFESVLQAAVTLGAPSIRVWAGNHGSEEAEESDWEKVVSDSRRIASLAEGQRVFINYEYHGGSLTDSKEGAVRLMKKVNHRNVGLYWQPAVGEDIDSRIESIRDIYDWLTHVHVFHWAGRERLSLIEGEEEWRRYLSHLARCADDRYAMLEFVKDDDPEQFLKDAKTLHQLIDNKFSHLS